MPLSRSFPIDSGFPNALDLRRLDAGLIAREGVFPDPTTIAAAGIAYANGGWNVGARAFVAALKRGGAPYSLTYGVVRLANDAAGTAWTIPAAPVSGSRIDLLWIRATDPGQGEATSGSDGPGGAPRAVPVFGVTSGVAATTPVAPALPSGALLVATVTTPSGAASIAGSTIVQSYRFAQLAGGTLYARSFAEFSGEPGYVGEEAVVLSPYQRYRYSGTTWAVAPYRLLDVVEYTASGSFVKANYPTCRALRVKAQGGGGAGGGAAATAAAQASIGVGGASGSYAEALITDIAGLAASTTVTVGAGGTGVSGATGNGGGSSSFGALVVAAGGGGGFAAAAGALPRYQGGRAGSAATAGDILVSGRASSAAITSTVDSNGSDGADSMLGTGGQPGGFISGVRAGGVGGAGVGYGAGGGGTGNTASAAAQAGGAGAPGIVIVEIYE